MQPPTQVQEARLPLAADDIEKQAVRTAMLRGLEEKRPIICFVCLGEESLPFEK